MSGALPGGGKAGCQSQLYHGTCFSYTWASVSPSVVECLLKRFFSEQNFQVYVMTIKACQARLGDGTNFTTWQEYFGARSLG